MLPHLSRRSLLLGSLGLGVTAGLAGCATGGSPTEAAGSTSPSATGWSFTDDTGVTVELDARPTRIAGLTDEIAALWNLGVVPMASFGMQSIADDPQFEGKDLGAVTEVGSAYGEIDLEKLAALAPELIVTHAYPDGKGGLSEPLYGFADAEQLEKVRQIAPVVAILQGGTVVDVAARQSELAAALGMAAADLADAKTAFSEAGDRLETAAADGLTVLSLAAYETDGVYVMRANDDPSFRYYTADLGLGYPTVAKDIFFWQHLSWEKIDTYQTDIVLFSTRAMGKAAMMEQPTFARLPAAKADQVYAKAFFPTDHRGQADQMNAIAEILENARKVTP